MPGLTLEREKLMQTGSYPPPPARAPTTAQVFLGIFILWQLFFLFAANFLTIANEIRDDEDGNYKQLLPAGWQAGVNRFAPGWLQKRGHVHDGLETLKGLTSRWEELTCQTQYWKLFAPDAARDITFVAAELRWDDLARPPVLLLSENEPPDPTSFFRVGRFRLRKYEGNLDVILRVHQDETLAAAGERWQERIRNKVRREWDSILPYLKLRWQDYRTEHPDCPPPAEVILHVRRYHIPGPEEFSTAWYKPDMRPLARWLPGTDESDPEHFPVEWYNPMIVHPEILALMCTWPQPSAPLNAVLAGYFRTNLVGDFEPLAR